MDTIKISPPNQKMLQNLQEGINTLATQKFMILKTILNQQEINEGTYLPNEDFSELVKQEEPKPDGPK